MYWFGCIEEKLHKMCWMQWILIKMNSNSSLNTSNIYRITIKILPLTKYYRFIISCAYPIRKCTYILKLSISTAPCLAFFSHSIFPGETREMAAGLLSLRARLVFFLLLGFAIICLNCMTVSGIFVLYNFLLRPLMGPLPWNSHVIMTAAMFAAAISLVLVTMYYQLFYQFLS